ncbi:ADP-ribosylglycohydrolase family protein [Nocardioidaceae bacterium]|nr:ADP-ribosylglycohydrolase family protein [Nocardioidaceae bacterium]
MRLITTQTDRAAGVILGAAAGDALGVPYEFATPPPPGTDAEMRGGGLGGFTPGEWSDDTAMAVAIARVAATGADLTTEAALDQIADGFLGWLGDGPADIGIQTSAVLRATARRLGAGERGAARLMREEAAAYAASHPKSAGNGALMRTAPVALTSLDDRDHLAVAARAVAELTHADPLAGDSCVLWSEAIRVAVLEERIDVRAGLDLLPDERRDQWSAWIDEALATPTTHQEAPGRQFTPNGFTVTALQAAVAAIAHTSVPPEAPERGSFACLHLQHALHAAVRIGDDTDTVAAIAGGLLGARWGAGAVPWTWRRAVHGWPGPGHGGDGRDLVAYATLTVRGGAPDAKGWPTAGHVDYADRAFSTVVPHPYDRGVLLGTHRSTGHGADTVVSMCRVGREQTCFDEATEVIESRLIDSEDPADNPHLGFLLADAADAVRGLRAEGKTVLLHCVAAHQRTPSVAVAYATLLGHDPEQAQRDVLDVLPGARGRGRVWAAAARVPQGSRG